MNWSRIIRQIHRWTSLVFVGLMALIFVTLGMGEELEYGMYFYPLAPLAVMSVTGMYMFFRPYFGRRGGE